VLQPRTLWAFPDAIAATSRAPAFWVPVVPGCPIFGSPIFHVEYGALPDGNQQALAHAVILPAPCKVPHLKQSRLRPFMHETRSSPRWIWRHELRSYVSSVSLSGTVHLHMEIQALRLIMEHRCKSASD
jgi:hypothetical protein